MAGKPVQRVQDAIHGLIEFQGLETSVVDVLRAEELQRLRRIRQLGLSHLVFPSGEHSRLAHSIGAAHLAIRFGRHLENVVGSRLVDWLSVDASVTRDLALAALCHDLGHGPLSHVWENEAVGDFDRTKWMQSLGLSDDDVDLTGLSWHELVWQGLLAWQEGQLHQLLDQQEDGTSDRVRMLLAGRYHPPYLPRLLAGDIDVDRCDYVARDARLTGVAYGRYDLDWLISTTTVGYTQTNDMVIGFDKRKALRVIEQFLVARRALYDTVYHHKTVKCAEGMVGLFLRRLRQLTRESDWPLGGVQEHRSIRLLVEGNALTPREVLDLDDYSL